MKYVAATNLHNRKFLTLFLALVVVFFWASRLCASPLDPWVWRNPLPIGNTITGVAYGNGVIVAVADTGTILTSPDATNWNIQIVGTGLGLNGLGVFTGVVFAQNQFVAVGAANTAYTQNAGVYTSPDGTNWTLQSVPGSFVLDAIAFGSNEYVAVGIVGSMFT